MSNLVLIFFLTFAVLVIIQVFFTVVTISSLRSPSPKLLSDTQLPKAAVVLCLRGADPSLSNCLRSLLQQNYPNYDINIIIDSHADPAWEILSKTLEQQPAQNIKVSLLQTVRETCSLKCSALVQAVLELKDEYEVIALVDADTLPHPNWLRQLVSPLTDRRVGAVTGNRWYVPSGRWGTVCRYLWNVAAVTQMYFYHIPWGGTLALKTKLFEQTQLLEKWGNALCEDTMLRQVLQEKGMRVQFVPSLMMVNPEECDLPSFYRWVKRQLLCSRLYHPSWQAMVGYSLVTTLVPAGAAILFCMALFTRQWHLATGVGSGLITYTLALVLLMGILEQGVRQVVQTRGEAIAPFSPIAIARLIVGIPLTQLVYAAAVVSAILMQQVEWRGITYQVKGPWNIKLVKYSPYQYLDQPVDANASL
ncbi:glycosyltransferase family 2 protein [Gloeocapsopsis crepidinum LEGE 06123]|uniref:Glycosyltransferase family 2 protein n=1 Tax=Gloeocapsopsis crepidinum LEGE 06123 TaxID=588587 RepID=A0ABR9UNY2_9CHRO|nr:glycosyltransferase family 2 protein [Gloeocapsopsis crepidinum]MBE9189740.1 glycosyltransferase family 2 protein [Gloeocapsopsis crepidinum LEGE 06123]